MITPSISTKELYTQLQILIDTDIPLFIHGSPGIGKSYIVNDIAKRNNLDIVDVRLSQLDAVDLRGIPTIDNNQTKWLPPEFLPSDKESEGILFLDELNSAPLSVQAAIYQLVLDRKIGEYTLPKGWRIVCAGNRIDDKGIVFKLPSPLINRMIHLVLEARYDEYKEWAIKNDIDSSIIGFLGFRSDLLSSEVPQSSETNPAFCTPRSWSMLSKSVKSVDKIDTILPIIYGSVGYGAGIEYISFIKVYKNLPNIDDILDGNCQDIPKEPSALYALCSAIVERYQSVDQAKYIFDYSKKLPVEFCVMLIKDLITKDESIASVDGFDEWIEKYGEYIL
jgi:hypothetical protein